MNAPHLKRLVCKNVSLMRDLRSGTSDEDMERPSVNVTVREIVGWVNIPLGPDINERALLVIWSESIVRSPSAMQAAFHQRDNFFKSCITLMYRLMTSKHAIIKLYRSEISRSDKPLNPVEVFYVVKTPSDKGGNQAEDTDT
jgi:hypothetical protein